MSTEIKGPMIENIEAPNVEPLTLEDIRTYLRINTTSEGSTLTIMLSAAREMAESYMKNSIIRQKWRMTFYGSVDTSEKLIRGPVSSVTSVKLVDENGVETLVDSSKYYLNGKNSLCFKSAFKAHKIEVEYYAGFSQNVSEVPELIKQGLLIQIASLYENRDSSGLDDGARAMFNFYKNIYL